MADVPGEVTQGDDLDGLSREELVALQIAKRRELLEPDDAPLAAGWAASELSGIYDILTEIRDALREIRDTLREMSV